MPHGYITWDWIDAQLHAHRSIWLSSTRLDGRPHAMPVWYWWDGRALYFITGRTTQKARNLVHIAHVVVHGWDGDDVVVLEGTAHLVTDPTEHDRLERAWAAKYVDPETGARDSTRRAHDLVFRVAVARIMAWMYGRIGGRTDYFPTADGRWEKRS
ncbi:MAG: pyridoxamine 5'-phosphate oxidase family protein [Jiangellaceae bacterium]|nr:pyridoxamine 5'-phosphate oxidase family protein [Jiangellaceae bacterium]